MKLKAWDNHEKRWAKTHEIEGELFINPEVGDTGVFYIHDHSASGKLHYTFIHPTGLRDKHGKEIWEGDKVRFLRKQGYWSHDKGDVEVVKYITDPQAQYCGFGFSALHPLTSRKAKKIEVIGDIFEGGE